VPLDVSIYLILTTTQEAMLSASFYREEKEAQRVNK